MYSYSGRLIGNRYCAGVWACPIHLGDTSSGERLCSRHQRSRYTVLCRLPLWISCRRSVSSALVLVLAWDKMQGGTRVRCLPSVIWNCWLGGRKGIRPVKNLKRRGTGMVICLGRDADLHMAQLMPLPLTVSCFSKMQIGFTFLVLSHPGSPRKRAIKWVFVRSY